ncbi:MAG TPA: PD-(D/E)XK nuclease family protein [Acidobacteriaceae bacterium]|jgi:probable DNA repair protein|nr:PD-(D/E)XK nuclease family protein [Acidobacteriaceae bacterium]
MPLDPQLADALRRGATVLAASPRAARALQLQYADTERAAGLEAWPAPAIADWDSWLRELWQEYAIAHPEAPMLLTPLQERSVWERVQREDDVVVLAPEAMAALAMEAWERLSVYNAHTVRNQSWSVGSEPTDAERFRRWAAAFERVCAQNNWISFSQIAPVLAADRGLALPAGIWLVGFDRVNPQQREFLSMLADCGTTVHTFALPPQDPSRRWIAAADARGEIFACATWAREILAENPGARIGVIVPAADELRGPIERIFRLILMPASEDIRPPAARMPWEFSLGHPLADVPVIRAALLMLRWIAQPLMPPDISWLLLSGFVSATVTQSQQVARFDADLRDGRWLLPERPLADCVARLAERRDLRALHRDLEALLHTAAASHVLDQERLPSAWTDLMHLLLERAAWPGERAPDSVRFQTLQRWQRLLDDLALLDFDGARCSFYEFLTRLERHAAETIFAPESHDAPVQIMGPFESSGQQFDALWFLGADDTNWPRCGRMHPLLPPAIQRQFAMPHYTPEDDWNLAHAVTVRLLASAPRIVFSYALHAQDAELRPSPLIAGLFPADAQPETAAAAPLAHSPHRLDAIPDESGAFPWPTARNAGGSDVLRRQSACPFQAFAVKRLAAEPLDEAEWGLDPMEKGKLLHAILERLFTRSLRSHADLVTAVDTNRLGALLEEAIDANLAEFSTTDSWQRSYLAAEKRRLVARLSDWLAYEAQRHPFTVEECEQKLPDVHIGSLRLKLRADRIDRLADGSRLIIDYKTGSASAAKWDSERPDEPQLPLYAAYGNVEELSGVVLAEIHAGKSKFDGRMRDAKGQLLPRLGASTALVRDPYTDAMRDEWARVLRGLAERFLAGEADVDPRDEKVCDQCCLHGLCRVVERNRNAAGDSEEEDGDD